VITGAGGGIGSAIARRLAAGGWAVGLLDIETSSTAELAAEIRAAGGDAANATVDVRDPDSVEAALDAIESELGPVDGLVTAAGVIAKAPFLELPMATFERTIGVNLTGTWLTVQRVARRIAARGGSGAIVAISSVAGRGGRAEAADYAASKAGVISVVRSASLALAAAGIRVNAVCPGVVDTAMTDAIHEYNAQELGVSREESIARMVASIPLGRIETGDDVASAVEYLLSEGAGYVTGQALNVCGGLEFD
jgi:NAD(P)-dependent dehydrogenase (short-subunit alcohol dehydrogenase family)